MTLAETEGAGRRLAGPTENGAQQAADAVAKPQPTGNARIATYTKLVKLTKRVRQCTCRLCASYGSLPLFCFKDIPARREAGGSAAESARQLPVEGRRAGK